MKNIALVTDSTADIPEELIKKYGISIAPLYIHTQGKEYRDKSGITNKQIYSLLEKNIEVKTSAPSPSDFKDIYSSIIEKNNPELILSIHISSKLSNTIDSANIAAKKFPDTDIKIFDSKTVSLSLGLIVLETAIALEKHKKDKKINHNFIDNLINLLIEKVLFLATVEDFEYLLRGGRVTGLKKFLRYMLKIKPIFITDDGRVKVSKISRTKKSAINTIIQDYKNIFSNRGKSRVGIFYGDDQDAAISLKQQIQEDTNLEIEEFLFSEITPVIGTHSGPTVIGLSAIPIF